MKHESIKGKVKDNFQHCLVKSDMFRPRAIKSKKAYKRHAKHKKHVD